MTDIKHCSSFTIVVMILFTVAGAPIYETAIIQAIFEIDSSPEDFIRTLLDKVDKLIEHKQNNSQQTNLNVATSLLQLGPSFTVHGNISDALSAVSVRFHFRAETMNMTESGMQLRDVTEEDGGEDLYDLEDFRGNGGILNPIVSTVEPYLVNAIGLVLHGILSCVIGKVMEGANMLGDVRIA